MTILVRICLNIGPCLHIYSNKGHRKNAESNMNKDYMYYELVAVMYKIISRHVSTIDVSHLQVVPLLKESMWY
jgi:hypothetical protein